ncbi:general transcription factor 3C polypeptide 4-like [Portunus trituberculatus]|uniref:general transcription factor 3C polypeptide 4-like n=1 Tax=Portunus trituberculatus TaxID=210409 RepID=UPI001E1D141A|nr:general transcription factor 3C polypeptide 4-like [Portunus trituberculatus]
MGKIEVRQLVQGVPFATAVLARAPLSWSADNNIALVTQHGVYILEVTLSPEECTPALMLTRFFLAAPDAQSSKVHPDIDLTTVLQTVDHVTGHAMMMDAMLSANQRAEVEQDPRYSRSSVSCMPSGEATHRGYQQGVWSPQGIGQHGRCVLALLTTNYKVTLVGRTNRYWGELANLSSQWLKYCSDEAWQRVKVPEDSPVHIQYKARMAMLAICKLVWTSMCEGEGGKYCMLIGLTEGGHAVFWHVATGCTSQDQVKLLSVQETDMTQIKSAHWHTTGDNCGYLTLGNSQGQVKILCCEFSHDHALLRDLGYAWENADRMIVNQTELCPIEDDQYLLLSAKHNILLVLSISLTTHHLAVNHTSHTFIGDLEISGLLVFDDFNVYAAAKDGFVKHVSIKVLNDGSTNIEPHDAIFHSEGVTYSDLVASPNKAMVCVFESIRVAYDHLIEREPTLINIYRVVETAKMVDWVLESPLPLHLIADVFESLRISVCKAGRSSLKVLQVDEIPNQSLQKLKAHFWLVKISKSVASSNEALLETLHTLSLMCDWVKKDGKQAVRRTVEPLAKRLEKSKREQCPVCRAPVQLKWLTHGQCGNGHTLPRCCRTLMLTEPSILCSRCRVYAHVDAKDIVEEDAYICTYCSGPMVSELNRRIARKQQE